MCVCGVICQLFAVFLSYIMDGFHSNLTSSLHLSDRAQVKIQQNEGNVERASKLPRRGKEGKNRKVSRTESELDSVLIL